MHYTSSDSKQLAEEKKAEQLQADDGRINTEWGLFCLIIVLIEKMVRLGESNRSFIAALVVFSKTLPPRMRAKCPAPRTH